MDSVLREIIDRIQAATADRTPLRIRGGGSKDFYGQALNGQLLDVGAFSGIISYEPSELVVTVRAGTPLAELEATLAEKGQSLAFEPPRFNSTTSPSLPTCGGMVAAGLSGPARANAGAVRDFVLGATLINGRGEQLTFGGQVIKNVAGYDVSRLLVGAMGTLGVMTEISIKVLPVASAEATLVFPMDQNRSLTQLHHWGGQPLPLSASCWVRDDTAQGNPELLFVRLRGAVAAVESACQKMTRDVPGTRMDNAVAAPDWQACRDMKLPFFTNPDPQTMALWRLSLPQTTPALNLPWPQLVEWHGAQRWLWAPAHAHEQLRQTAAACGGTATIFRAPDHFDTATCTRFSPLKAPLGRIHQKLMAEFDPAGIFNPGRLYAEF